jgi:hypothetical protein
MGEINLMIGDKEIDDSLWYDMIANQIDDTDENSKLATPLQKGEKTTSQTSSHATGEGES